MCDDSENKPLLYPQITMFIKMLYLITRLELN